MRLNNFLLRLAILTTVIMTIASAGCDRDVNTSSTQTAAPVAAIRDGTLKQVRTARAIKAGWAPYPPYAMKDLQTGKIQGFYPELFERAMTEANLRVDWVETTWSTMIADIKVGKFSVMAAPVFRTPARALEVAFTRDISRFGLSALAKTEDAARFAGLDTFDQPEITIAVVVGEVGHDFTKRRLPHAKLIEHSSGNISVALLDVLQGRAKVGITDALTIQQFAAEHADKVTDLFANKSFDQVGAGWFVAPEAFEFLVFLNTTIDWLESSGTMDELALKYRVPPKSRP